MKKSKNIIPAKVIAIGLIPAAFIYAFAHRYEVETIIGELINGLGLCKE